MDADFWKGFYIGQSLKPILWRAKGEVEQWETLYENTALRSYEYGAHLGAPEIGANIALVKSDVPVFTTETELRLTVDGVTIPMSVILYDDDPVYPIHIAGNPYLVHRDTCEDVGGDYALQSTLNAFAKAFVLYFYSRYEGTYSVKIERRVTT